MMILGFFSSEVEYDTFIIVDVYDFFISICLLVVTFLV